MSKLLILATAALFVGSVSAHTIFQKLYVNGVDQGYLTGIRVPDYDGVSMDEDAPPFDFFANNCYATTAYHGRELQRHYLQRSFVARAHLFVRELFDRDLGINPYHQPMSKAVINVPAGATLTAEV